MFLGFGINMWMCLFGPLPTPTLVRQPRQARSTSSPCASPARCSATSSCGRAPSSTPSTSTATRIHHISPLADQNIAGAIMMVEESILTLGLFCWLFLRTARESEERQDLLDFAHAQGLELTEARAARAVAAGRGAELRRRLEARQRAPRASSRAARIVDAAARAIAAGMCAGCAMAAASAATRLQDLAADPQLRLADPAAGMRALTIGAMCAAGARLDDRLQRLDATPRTRVAPRDASHARALSAAASAPSRRRRRAGSSARRRRRPASARPSRKRMSSPAR